MFERQCSKCGGTIGRNSASVMNTRTREYTCMSCYLPPLAAASMNGDAAR